MTVNEDLYDAAVRHAIQLQRYANNEVHKIVELLNRDVLPDLVQRIERRLEQIEARGFDKGSWTTQRLRRLRKGLRENLRTGISLLSGELTGDLRDLALTEAEWQQVSIRRAVPIELDLLLPAPGTLRSIATSKPLRGELLRGWWKGIERNTITEVERQISIGLVEGDSTAEIVRRIRGTRAQRFTDGVLQKSRRHIASVVRTAVNHVSTHAREATYEANSDVIKAVQYVATLDSRTTPTCAALDGRVFRIGDGPRPPMHINCRSDTIPVVKSWRELGVDIKEAPAGTRASMDGQVPAIQSFGQWLKKQPNDIQTDVLGKTRAELFRSGRVTIDRFVDHRFNKLTLEQLRTREGL